MPDAPNMPESKKHIRLVAAVEESVFEFQRAESELALAKFRHAEARGRFMQALQRLRQYGELLEKAARATDGEIAALLKEIDEFQCDPPPEPVLGRLFASARESGDEELDYP